MHPFDLIPITNLIYAFLRSDAFAAFRSCDFSFIRSHWADRYNCQKIYNPVSVGVVLCHCCFIFLFNYYEK